MKRYDESPLTGQALYTVTPETLDELCAVVRTAAQEHQPVQCIGGATNFVGSAVPQQAAVVYTNKLNRLRQLEYIEAIDEYRLTVEAGLSIGDLQTILAGKQLMFDEPDETTQAALATLKATRDVYFFPPDPSEGGATLGGVLAASSGGSSAYYYGQSKDYFVRATYVDYTGAVHEVYTGSDATDIDLLYGSEGQNGIIYDVTIRLLKAPATAWATLIHFERFADLLNFKKGIQSLTPSDETQIVAFDFFSYETVRRTIELGSTFPAFKRMSAYAGSGCYSAFMEIVGPDEERVVDLLSEILMCASEHTELAEEAIAATGPSEVKQMKELWHSCIEGMNHQVIVTTDAEFEPDLILHVSGSDAALLKVYELLEMAESMNLFMLGHIGSGDFFLRIMPDSGERPVITGFYQKLLEQAASLGLRPSGEFGNGILKRRQNKVLMPDGRDDS